MKVGSEMKAKPKVSCQEPKFLLKILLCRCSDRAPTVRAKALQSLATAVRLASLEDDHCLGAKFAELLSEEHVSFENSAGNADADMDVTPVKVAGGRNGDGDAQISPFHPSRPGMPYVFRMLHARVSDSRTAVRKGALQALEAVVMNSRAESHLLTEDDLQVFYDGCMDVSPSIRKQSAK